jgi:O-6-methylguanine DNA methyltransferase
MEGGSVIAVLRELRDGPEQAPAGLVANVLREVGLADGYAITESPLGPVIVAFGADGITAVTPAVEDETAFSAGYRARHGRAVNRVDALPAGLLDRPRFDLRDLSDFERDVLEVTRTIPNGQVRPYSWVAREIGRPGAVRAVGSALGRNPIPWLIPCHRVVRSDGRIGDYAFGSDAKRTVLMAEGVDLDELEQWARQRTRFVGSDTTHIYCFPTCRHARRVTEGHRVALASPAAAEAAGYRPCKVCRP